MIKSQRNLAYLAAALACAMILSSCFFRPAPPNLDEQLEKTGQFISKGGYSGTHEFAIESTQDIWLRGNRAIEVSMLTPTEPGNYPLIIYLPGLGEHSDNGKLWREAWAKAGYAVFSLQPTELAEALKEAGPMMPPQDDDDKPGLFSRAQPRPSNGLRNSELHYLGREYFAQTRLQQRVDDLLWAYAQLKLKTYAGSDWFASADTSKVIVAGYDIGAQTVAAAIGETTDIDLSAAKDFKPMAAMLFSPSVDMAQGNVATRYKNISLPLLTVTGSEDNDPYGISSADVRTAIWEYAPKGHKYLLLLNKGGHELLSGSGLQYRQPPGGIGPGSPPSGGAMPGFVDSFRDGGRHSGADGFPGGMARHGVKRDGDQDARHIAAVFSVSDAFLDSIGKPGNNAETWLADKANQWLKKSATLKIK